MEIFDELNDKGELTGQKIARDEAHKTGAWHKAVVLFLLNKKKQVLLQKRSMEKKNWPGRWDVTSGGHVDSGETGVEAAIRELREELGINIDSKEVALIGTAMSSDIEGGMINRHFNEYYVAQKEVDVDTLTLQKGEVDEVKWIPCANLEELVEKRSETLTAKWDAFGALASFIRLDRAR